MFLHKRPVDTYEQFINTVRFCSRILGVDVLKPNYRINWQTVVVIMFIIIFLACSMNTIYKFIGEDWTVLLEVLCTMAAGLTGAVKLLSVIRYAEKYYELHTVIYGIYEKYQQIDERYQLALRKSCARTRTILRLVGLVYVQMVALPIGLPLVIIFVSGKHYPIILFDLPGFDVSTDFGYWVTFVFQASCCIIAGFGLYAGDMFIIICLTNFLLFVDILKLKIKDLNDQIEINRKAREYHKITTQLHDIVQWHQSYFSFIDSCNFIFFWIITVQIFLSALSIILTLFIIMYKDWPGAYAYLLYSVNSLYEYCILGTRIEICNDMFCNEIYNINWYDLNIAQQKTVYMMLRRSQSPRSIDIGGVMPLSVSTALTITRNIYSMCMMMLRLQD